MKLDFFKKNKDSFKPKKNNLNPNVYWIIIFFTGLFLTLCSFAFGFYMFAKVEKIIGEHPTSPELELLKVNRAGLNEVIEYFNKKHEIRNDILNTEPLVVDPSV